MEAAEDPSRTVFSSQRTNSSPTSTSPVAILYNALRVAETSASESVSNIRSFIHSTSRIAAARDLRGREAQKLIDLVDQVE